MTHPAITLDSRVRWSRNHLAADVSGEVVLMSIQRGAYYGLDGVGSGVWRRLSEPVAVADLCAALAAEYEADPDVLRRDVLAFLAALAEEGLVETVAADA